MKIVPEHVTGVYHPMVREMYLKKDFGNGLSNKAQDVLVIETVARPMHDDEAYDTFDSYLLDILGDLDDLKSQAQNKIGHFDRVDIRTH
jgi:hypothetical protein